MKHHQSSPPAILAPAGNKASFLAALAAGADEIYCGLKQFSARMEVKNFSLQELSALTRLAHDKGTKVHVAINSLLKTDELDKAGKILKELHRWVKPDALIIQDLSLLQLARQTGFSGKLHLSTLSNVSFASALKLVKSKLRVHRIVLPRELNIDEIKAMASDCPKGLDLELFVHGALCYGVSGRCYWSSYLGGKSGLRGRCVQPCRRVYTQKSKSKRFFSCRDLSLDVLVKVLLTIPRVRAWKIEGRKKGPHYVFYTVKAYRILRDHGSDPKMKKQALTLLSYALGRTGTHYNFLPQRPQNPVRIDTQTGSGLLVGKVKGTQQKPFLIPREELLSGDLLRIGYEDESWHGTQRVGKTVPKGGRFFLKNSSKTSPVKGAPVFLTDRREKSLEDMMSGLEKELNKKPVFKIPPAMFTVRLLKKSKSKSTVSDLHVFRKPEKTKFRGLTGLWLQSQAKNKMLKSPGHSLWWWLPPVIWPEDEKNFKGLVGRVLKKGARNFVLNAPWQLAFFSMPKKLNLWAGPFCNITNPLAIKTLASLGVKGAIVSPELGRKDYRILPKHSSLPLGIVISGNWPLCISRIISERLDAQKPMISPKGEESWVQKFESDYWVYPNWKLDISAKKNQLEKAGYRLFVHLVEPIPKEVTLKKRPGLWNWDLDLL
ncbi:MAG: U32 family peptidase [Deltaproteobacteria bacterium]|nr:U32 family peptidase [Deltaproteobacteria bacterium]